MQNSSYMKLRHVGIIAIKKSLNFIINWYYIVLNFSILIFVCPIFCEYQCSKLTFSKSRLLATFNCKVVTITRLLPEFWSPKIFSTRHGDQTGRSLERCLHPLWIFAKCLHFMMKQNRKNKQTLKSVVRTGNRESMDIFWKYMYTNYMESSI